MTAPSLLHSTGMLQTATRQPAGRGAPEAPSGTRTRERLARVFTYVEDVVYLGLGLLLTGAVLVLLADSALMFWRSTVAGDLPARVITLLDRVLLIVMIAEILYTVQVSFRQHALIPEPFLVIGLIAGIRRVLVLTAEFADLVDADTTAFANAMTELALLTALVLVLVVSLVLLRRRSVHPTAPRD